MMNGSLKQEANNSGRGGKQTWKRPDWYTRSQCPFISALHLCRELISILQLAAKAIVHKQQLEASFRLDCSSGWFLAARRAIISNGL